MSSDSLIRLGATAAGAIAASIALHAAVFFVLRRVAPRLSTAGVLARRTQRAARAVAVVVAAAVSWSANSPRWNWSGAVSHGLAVVQIAAFAWLIMEAILAFEDISFHRYDISVANNLRARKLRTQILVLRRVTVAVVAIIAVAAILLTFRSIRLVGTSLLASAGIAGLVAGTAARPVLGNLISGIQLAFTEPIRLDDVLVIDGEFGWVEEITLSYVVLRLWDQRRLVLPVSYFTANPFENWTRNSADLLGTVVIYVDYTAPIEAMRDQLRAILADCPLWDGRTAALQVTDATERSLQVRVLVSARDSGSTFDLRCEVREKLIAWLGRHHPEGLPTSRVLMAEETDEPVRDCRPSGQSTMGGDGTPDRGDRQWLHG